MHRLLWISCAFSINRGYFFANGVPLSKRHPISCALSYQEFNLLILQCEDNAGHDYYKNSYEIPQKNYGKYMHISIALSMHSFNGVNNFFISFQINNENIVINIA